MKKILEVSCNGLTNGGVQHVIMNIVSELHEKYIFDILVFTRGPEYFDDKFLSFGGHIFRLPNKGKVFKKDIDVYFRGPRIILGVYKILKEYGPYAAIHCHNYFESAFCLLAAKLAGVDIRIVHSHNDLTNVPYSKLRKVYNAIMRIFVNKFATIRIGCSKNATDYLFGKQKKAIIVNNGIHLEPFMIGKENLGYTAQDRIKLLHVGNFSPQKNQSFLVELAQELKRKKIDFELKLIGGGPEEYRNGIIDKIEEYGLQEEVVVLPSDTYIPTEMKNADLFLFPSLYEGLGIVVIEAQATGLHCIVSRAVPSEADLGNIEYVDDLSLNAWTKAVINKVQNGQKRLWVDMSTYDIKNIVRFYDKLYNGLDSLC